MRKITVRRFGSNPDRKSPVALKIGHGQDGFGPEMPPGEAVTCLPSILNLWEKIDGRRPMPLIRPCSKSDGETNSLPYGRFTDGIGAKMQRVSRAGLRVICSGRWPNDRRSQPDHTIWEECGDAPHPHAERSEIRDRRHARHDPFRSVFRFLVPVVWKKRRFGSNSGSTGYWIGSRAFTGTAAS